MQSDKIDALAKALVAAQGEVQNADLNKINPHFKSKYADLAAIRAAVVPVFSKHGLAVTQLFEEDEHGAYINTMLLHDSGQFLTSRCPIKADKGGPQPFGSAATYARRYSLAAIAGITAEEDDDANAAQDASKKADTNGAKQATPKASGKKIALHLPGQNPAEFDKPADYFAAFKDAVRRNPKVWTDTRNQEMLQKFLDANQTVYQPLVDEIETALAEDIKEPV